MNDVFPDESSVNIGLTEQHEELLIHLAISSRRDVANATRAVSSSPELARLLREAMVRVLADPGYAAAWREKLRQLQTTVLIGSRLGESEVQRLLKFGPQAIASDSIVRLALSPDEVERLQEQIAIEFPPLWEYAIKQAMQRSANERGVYRKTTAEVISEIGSKIESTACSPFYTSVPHLPRHKASDSAVVVCNGVRIAGLRRSLNLTQQQLAETAGYSTCLIRKVENGGQARSSTVTAIAAAYQRHGLRVTARDLCTDPLQIVQAFVEAYREHEAEMVRQIRHLVSETFVVFVAGDPIKIPFAGTYRGLDGLKKFWDRCFGLIERCDKTALELQYYVHGGEVVAYGNDEWRVQGQAMGEWIWLCLKFQIEGGLITRFECYFDTAAVHERLQKVGLRKGTELAESPDPPNTDV